MRLNHSIDTARFAEGLEGSEDGFAREVLALFGSFALVMEELSVLPIKALLAIFKALTIRSIWFFFFLSHYKQRCYSGIASICRRGLLTF